MKLRTFEAVIAGVLILLAATVFLPMLSRARESAHRASCQNNLKQMGIVLKMYANESKGENYPPLSPRANNWMVDVRAVYPEYLSDLSVLICPGSPLVHPNEFRLRSNGRHLGETVGALHPDCVTGKYYTYTGYMLNGDEPALALYLAYHARPEAVRQMQNLTLPIPRWGNSDWSPTQGGITVLWDRIPVDTAQMPHDNDMINVLCMDGSVRAVRYSPLNHSENFPVTEMTAITFGLDTPEVEGDCY